MNTGGLHKTGELTNSPAPFHVIYALQRTAPGVTAPAPRRARRAGAAPPFAVSELGVVRPIRTVASIEEPSYDTRIDMDTVTLSPKFQVVIPQAIREALHLTAGEKLRVLRYADRVEFIPVRPIQQMRGFLRGMDTTIEREDDRL
jgi:AbrB family looped-hinge helix DNA binding protein